MSILKLSPSYKDYLWGGSKLIEDFNKVFEGDVLAESWELSCHPDGPSTIVNGAFASQTLRQYIETKGSDVLGTNCKRFEDFPILIKFIDAKDDLSIQVHPKDEYALKYEGQYGKTEMWYVVDCKEGASLYFGFNQDISTKEFEDRIQNNTLLEVLNEVPVKKGDVFFIEAGTIHAIKKDIVIAEIQQNSNMTYRVYDYDRRDANGNGRELHVEKAIAVTNTKKVEPKVGMHPSLAKCEYFTVDKVNLDGKYVKAFHGLVSDASFLSILIVEGSATIQNDGECVQVQKGDCVFIDANSGEYSIDGTCEALLVHIDA